MGMSANHSLAISQDELINLINKNQPMLLFDLRLKEQYEQGHIDGASHAVCDARAKETIMPKIPKTVKIVLVDEDEAISKETAEMMKSIGFDAQYLKGGMKSWTRETVKRAPQTTITSDDLWQKIQNKQEIFLLDVREPDEFSDFRIPESTNIPLSDLFKPEVIARIPKGKEIITICPHGNRAMVATFALAKNGIASQTLTGGLTNWNQILNPVKISDSPIIIQIEKIGKGCLSYIAASNGDAVVIDPLYPPEKYQEIAKKYGFKITKIIDTHQHADHVSSARDLARITGGTVYESSLEQWELKADFLKNDDIIVFGKSKIRVMHTPGHTPGSMSYVVNDKIVFTGDILFVESIGRPDLRDKVKEFAVQLYDSLHNKLLKMPPSTLILPAHHGQSVKPENGIFSTTIEKAKQHAILKLSKEEFVKKIEKATLPRPMNYRKIIEINKGSIPLTEKDIPDLEIGPNRCSIAGQ